jgi:DNA-binding transcriptional regulator YhcF (GntR family)
MENEFVTLQTIYDIVKNDVHPETYLCSAREIILRQMNDWDTIKEHLKLLEEKEFVVVKQLDKIAISITRNGINKVKDSHLIYRSILNAANNALTQ